MRKFISGDVELERTLKNISDKIADRVAKAGVRAGMTVIKKSMKSSAPIGKTSAVRDSIGSRFVRERKTKTVTAKVGVNVGKRTKKKGTYAPHAHLVALGTAQRYRKAIGGRFSYLKRPTKRQLSTGMAKPNSFVRRAYEQSRSTAIAKMRAKAAERLEKELAKIRKG